MEDKMRRHIRDRGSGKGQERLGVTMGGQERGGGGGREREVRGTRERRRGQVFTQP